MGRFCSYHFGFVKAIIPQSNFAQRGAAIWRCPAISNPPRTPGREFLSRIERWSILNRNPFSILLASHSGWKQKEDSYGHDNVISYCFGRHFARRGRLGILSLEG